MDQSIAPSTTPSYSSSNQRLLSTNEGRQWPPTAGDGWPVFAAGPSLGSNSDGIPGPYMPAQTTQNKKSTPKYVGFGRGSQQSPAARTLHKTPALRHSNVLMPEIG